MLRILHIAPENIAGVPYSFYDMHNKTGDFSRLVTMHSNPLNFKEDICLNLKLPRNNIASGWRRKKVRDREEQITQSSSAKEFKPKNIAESIFFLARDVLRTPKINRAINLYGLNSFDVIFYHAGLDFYRFPKQAIRWKKEMGKKIVCFYHGSDLRIRGYIKALDQISDLNLTSEFDLLKIKNGLEFLFYPYDSSELPQRVKNESGKIRIVHSPTNRKYKGTDLIISVIEKIKSEKDVEFLLLEKMTRDEVLQIKATADISIDQVGGTMGGTGYGKAGLESLAMGIPTITNMTDEYKNWLPENPFVVCNNGQELYNDLIKLIEDKGYREKIGEMGQTWAGKYHGYNAVSQKLKTLLSEKKIISG